MLIPLYYLCCIVDGEFDYFLVNGIESRGGHRGYGTCRTALKLFLALSLPTTNSIHLQHKQQVGFILFFQRLYLV